MRFNSYSRPLRAVYIMRTGEALMVTPRSRSRSMLSRTCSVISRGLMVPVCSSRRSARVDLP